MLKIAVLVSGGGTNLQAIIDAIREGTIHDARIGLVLSNNHGVYALERAKKAGIPSCVLSPREFESREALNIHPSLIPSFCGTGFYGLKVHEAALERGVKVSGATVHFVDSGTDTGPILLQKAVPVQPDDTPKTLQKRIMEQAEWKILPQAIDLIARGRVLTEGNRVTVL